MRIREKHVYHGAALTQIVEHAYFTALNKADEKYGHYVLNANTRIVLKYSSSDSGPWKFTFQPDDIRVLRADFQFADQVFVCLVCGGACVCALGRQEIMQVLDLDSGRLQTVSVRVPKGGSMHVRGSLGDLRLAVPHSSFPSKLFL